MNTSSSRLVALLNSTHPIPSFAVASFTVLFGLGLLLPAERLVLIGLAVLTQQFSVGLSNDWLDYERDTKVARPDKPLAAGKVSIRLVRNLSFLMAVVAILLAFLLNPSAGLWMVVMMAVGWSYNLGLKSTGLSVIPYAIGFGTLPVFVTLSQPDPSLPLSWVILVAALLGVSAHFANTLPDLFEDRQTGVRALPHLLGQRLSAVVIALTAALASLLVITQGDNLNPILAVFGFSMTMILALVASALALRTPPPRIIFPLLMLASLVNVMLLMLNGIL